MKSTITDEFGKEIDIDTAIDTLRGVRRHHYDGTPYEVRLASLMAIATMRKYQKIQEIIKDWEDGRFSDGVGCLRVKVVLDENVD